MRFQRMGRRRVHWRFVIFTLLVLTVVSTISTLNYFDTNLRPSLLAAAEAYTKELATTAINESIAERITDDANYNNLINFHEGQDGRVQAGFFNLNEAAKLQDKATMSIQHALHNLEEKELKIPAGVALENTIMANWGPDVPIRVTPVGHVTSKVDWETREAGINQTVHILYLNIHVDASVIIPFASKEIVVETKAPIAYLVLVGDVPQMVFNAKGESLTSGNSAVMPPLQLPDLNQPQSQPEGAAH